MSDFKLRFSDIFKYILLGAFQAILCKYTLDLYGQNETFQPIKKGVEELWKLIPADPVGSLILSLCVFYLMGFLTQMFILLFCKGNFMGTGLGEVGCFVKRWPSNFLNTNKYPHWMYYSKHPDKVLSIYREIMETSSDADITTEYLYANNLFQGLALSLIIFACLAFPTTSIWWNIGTIISFVTASCVFGYFSTKTDWALRLNKLSLAGIPVLIFMSYGMAKDWQFGFMTGGGVFLCLGIAEQLSRRHIRRIDMLIKYANQGKNENRFLQNLKRNGLPTAFILTRVGDSSFDYYADQLASIKNQIYPNIKAIVLIDRNAEKYDDFVRMIEECRKKDELNISHFMSEGTGPACLAYEIRDLFLNFAESDDVAISLDGDDIFASSQVVARIMGRLGRTKANICLITFEVFGDTKINYTKSHPNEIVKRIAEQSTDKGFGLRADDLLTKFDAHLISSIGWTKCYKADVLRKYQNLWNNEKRLVIDMMECSKYEDFPDIIPLLMEGSRVCAVGRTSILFRKHEGSVTTAISADNYRKHITHYLKKTLVMSMQCEKVEREERLGFKGRMERWVRCMTFLPYWRKGQGDTDRNLLPRLSEEAKDLIQRKYIPYKFIQYLNIVKIKTTGESPQLPGFSANDFYAGFITELAKVDEGYPKVLREGMLEIIRDNYKFKQCHHAGYYGKDMPATLCRKEVTFEDVIKAYALIVST